MRNVPGGNVGADRRAHVHDRAHLLLRLQRRIREGILSSEDIRIYYIDANKELGSYVQLIEMDDQGEFITAWPNGFFPERLDEMLA